jgi:hypothetical protein
MPVKHTHVVPDPKGGWNIKQDNAQRASRHTDTKAEAEKAAREISQNQGTELVIHNLDGKISRSDSHGHDPCPPEDKK